MFSGTLLLFLWSNRHWQFDLVSSAFSKSSANIWQFMVHVLLKPGSENFVHYFPSMWDGCNFAVVWIFFGIAFLWDWNENWPFLVLWPLLSFPNLLAYWMKHFISIISDRQSAWRTMDGGLWLCTEAVIKTILKKKKCKKSKWLFEDLQIAEKKREAKGNQMG